MNHLTFKRDFAYKFIKSTSIITSQEKPQMILPLWRSNRLSLVRVLVFIESFFKDAQIANKLSIKIKYKRSNKKQHKKFIFFIHVPLNDTPFLLFFLSYLPEPICVGSNKGYKLIYPFNHFTIHLPFDMNQPIFTYKYLPYIRLFTYANIYKYLNTTQKTYKIK
jgi:hypothetical protein